MGKAKAFQKALLIAALSLAGCEKPDMVCCQYYDGKSSGAVFTTREDYEQDVFCAWGADMEGELEYDSAKVMFIYCKQL